MTAADQTRLQLRQALKNIATIARFATRDQPPEQQADRIGYELARALDDVGLAQPAVAKALGQHLRGVQPTNEACRAMRHALSA